MDLGRGSCWRFTGFHGRTDEGPVGAPRVCVSALSARGSNNGPRLAGAVVDAAGVVAVGRTYGASLFTPMDTYINVFMGIIPRIKSVILQYSNLPPGCRGIIVINLLMYTFIRLNSEAPYFGS